MLDRRLLALRQLRAAGWPLATLLVAVLVVRALLPALTALLTGRLVAEIIAGSGDADLSLAVAVLTPLGVLLLAGQLTELMLEPVRFQVVARVDGAHRRAVEAMVCAPAGIAHLEDLPSRELLAQAAGDPDNSGERTPGLATVAQLSLMSRYLATALAALVIARDVWWLAPVLLIPVLALRSVQHRQVLGPVHAWTDAAPDRRRAGYWAALLTGPEAGKELRIFGLGDWFAARHSEATDAHLEPYRKARLESIRKQVLQFLVITVVMGVTLGVLGRLAMTGQLPVDRLAGDLAAAWSLLGTAFAVPEILDVEHGTRPLLALQRLRERLGSSPAPSATTTVPALRRPPAVRFAGVRFGYPGARRDVLTGLDLEVRPGEMLALVGLNGAGKSTVTKLLAGLYRPDGGRISAEGTDIGDLDPVAWRAAMSIVFQNFTRYHLSVRRNVTIGAPDHDSAADLAAVAAETGLDDLVAGLPDGWDTPLSTARAGGVELSGGQWQRVVLARALYAVRAGARILVLDEPTAHLDVRTEFEIFRSLRRITGDVTVLLISHRLATVREADRIALIADGRIRESGTHDELVAADGEYADLFRIQAQRFATTGQVNP
ncbi:ABC transporter ATP-binding protein [Micromonospora sp. DT43]|uniref:ABC transporter ATP-binding protein n=1 Tax=Micromonospora sp. DT43 TaxID=3393440 RepID=UPI003CE80E8F